MNDVNFYNGETQESISLFGIERFFKYNIPFDLSLLVSIMQIELPEDPRLMRATDILNKIGGNFSFMNIIDNQQTLREFVAKIKSKGIDGLCKEDKDAIVECFEALADNREVIFNRLKSTINVPVNTGDTMYMNEHVLYTEYYRNMKDEHEYPFKVIVNTVTVYPQAPGGGMFSVKYCIDECEMTLSFDDIGNRIFFTREEALDFVRETDN